MVYSFLQALKRAVVFAQFRLSEPLHLTYAEPEPRIRMADGPLARDTSDDWLFDEPHSALSPAIHGLSGELNRVAGALDGLRTLLGEMTRFTPQVAVPVNVADSGIIPLGLDRNLFDTDALPRLADGTPFISGDAVFLFDEAAPSIPISVFDCPLQDRRIAA